MNKKVTLFTIIVFVCFCFVFIVINTYHNEKVNTLTHNKYLDTSNNIKEHIQQAIIQKKAQGLTLALSLAQNEKYINFFENTNELINLKPLTNDLKKFANLNNIWVHFVSKDGISLHRSWAKKKGDNVAIIRKELPKLLQNPKPVNIISVGIFDISFKNIVPVYKNDRFLGLIEVISKMNSVARNIKEMGYEPIIVVDKKYKEQIKKPFTKKFVNDYYVANLNASDMILDDLRDEGLNDILSTNDYIVKNDNLITVYTINDMFDEKMAYFIIYKDTSTIDLSDINDFNNFIQAIAVFILLLFITIVVSIYFYDRSRYTKKLEKSVSQKTKELEELKDYRTILFNKNPNIVFVAAINKGIIEANESFFEFFDEYSNIEEFNAKNNCLCQFAVQMDDETYIDPTSEWKEQVTNENRKLCIEKNSQKYHFRLESEILEHKIHNEVFLITLTDITKLINAQIELEEKKELINQQKKLTSMGEMIGNIAHQWRQPLSSISTMASGLKLHNQMNLLSDSDLNESMDMIVQQTKYLSQTIEDFRTYLKNDDIKEDVQISTIINKVLSLEKATMKNNEINVLLDLKDDFEINVYPNQIIQALMNILNNAKDALKANNECIDRFIFIEITTNEKNENTIIIKDNAGGIPQDVISRVFEPYFTTKHQSVGTGIGLSIAYDIFVKYHNSSIQVTNETYTYNNTTYTGACFKITF